MRYIIVIIVAVIVGYFIFTSGNEKPEKTDEPATTKEQAAPKQGIAKDIDSAAGYATGHTQVYAGQRAKAKVYQNQIDQAVGQFQALEMRTPKSLQEMVDAGVLTRQSLKDEWNRPLWSGVENNMFVVRAAGRDRKFKTGDDWVKKYPIK